MPVSDQAFAVDQITEPTEGSQALDRDLHTFPQRPVGDHGRKLRHVLSCRSGTERRHKEPAIGFRGWIGPGLPTSLDVSRECGNDLAREEIKESAVSPDWITFQNCGHPLKINR